MVSSNIVEVQVKDGTLWIGSAAYPLRNISSVEPVKYTRTEPAKRYVSGCGAVIGWFITTAVVAGTLGAVHQQALASVAAVLLIAAFIFIYIKARKPERTWTYYQLHIGAGGVRQVVLNIASANEAHDLTSRISTAIANPARDFKMTVENLHIGDNNTTHGPNSPIGS